MQGLQYACTVRLASFQQPGMQAQRQHAKRAKVDFTQRPLAQALHRRALRVQQAHMAWVSHCRLASTVWQGHTLRAFTQRLPQIAWPVKLVLTLL